MEVNRENFNGVFPKIQHLLQTCEFYSFDLEMTGINPIRTGRHADPEAIRLSELPHNCRFYSTPEDSFPGKWEAASTFSPMQLGISIFHKKTPEDAVRAFRQRLTCNESSVLLDEWLADGKRVEGVKCRIETIRAQLASAVASMDDATSGELDAMERISRLFLLMQELDSVSEFIGNHREDGSSTMEEYMASTFHCHLFPSYHYGDGEMKMSIETVGSFLSDHNMDFNAWVRKSLLYAPRETIAKARLVALRRAQEAAANGDLSSPSMRFNQDLLGRIPATDLRTVSDVFATLESFADENKDNRDAKRYKALPYVGAHESFSAILAKAKSLGLRIEKGDIAWDNTSANGGSSGGGSIQGGPDAVKHQATLLIEAMINSRKPVIVHNSWSDLLFLYRAVHATPLHDYPAFKTAMRKLFPVLYDTRTLSSLDVHHRLGQVRGALDRTYTAFRKEHEASTIRITTAEWFAEGSNAAHNAGYDAYITGSLFLYARVDMRKHGIPLEQLNGVLPVYASIFSISLLTEYDYLVQARASPIFYAIPSSSCRGGAFVDRLSALLSKVNLPAIVMNCGDSALAFVTADARGTGSLLDSSVAAAQRDVGKQLPRAQLINMDVATFVDASNGRIRFLEVKSSTA